MIQERENMYLVNKNVLRVLKSSVYPEGRSDKMCLEASLKTHYLQFQSLQYLPKD